MIYTDIQFIFFFLIIIQTIIGVGVLVLGTPILLLLNFNIIETISILLPLSILTSFINLLYFKFKKKKLDLTINKQIKSFFFFICLPCILLGLIILKKFGEILDFKTIVSVVLLFSIFLSTKKEIFKKISNKGKKIILAIIGVVHGLTNSGGSLLSLLLVSRNNKQNSRYNITYFYFLLAFAQYLLFLVFFKDYFTLIFEKNFFLIFTASIILGNFLARFINEKLFKQFVNLICLFTCFVLLSVE